MNKLTKTIKERIERHCIVCATKIKVILYADRSYRGGHYFKGIGETRKEPIKSEYWECPKCYRTP